jgi:hypothetical protein
VRERRPGEIPGKAFRWRALEGKKPKGATGSQCVNSVLGVLGTLARVKAQKLRLARTGRRFDGGGTGRGNSKWVLPGGNVWIPCERGKLRRVNPMSAVDMKQGRHGLGGSKPSRG